MRWLILCLLVAFLIVVQPVLCVLRRPLPLEPRGLERAAGGRVGRVGSLDS
jgi:hypothetical protein